MSFYIDIFADEGGSGDTNNLLDWVAGEDYLQFSERVYDFKLYVSLIRINDGRTTVPSEDGEGWRQAGILSQVPDVPAATSSTVNYNLQRPAAVPEAGVTIKFNANPTTTGARTYIQGFPSAVTNLNAGTLIEFTNGSLAGRVTTQFSDGNVGPGIRINIENSSRNNTLTQKVAEFVSIINNDVRFNIEALVSSIDSEWIEIFYTDKEIDIVPTNITVKTQSDAGIPSNLPDDYSMTIPSEAPTKIVEAPLAVWSIDTGGGEPDAYIKSSSITGTTSISLTDQDDTVTTFTPSASPAAFVKSTAIDGTTSVTFTDKDDVETTFTPAASPDEYIKGITKDGTTSITWTDQDDSTSTFTPATGSTSEDIPVFYRDITSATLLNSSSFTRFNGYGSGITDDNYSFNSGAITVTTAARYRVDFNIYIPAQSNGGGVFSSWQISTGVGGALAPFGTIRVADTSASFIDHHSLSGSYVGAFNANATIALFYTSNAGYANVTGTFTVTKLIEGASGGSSGFAPNPAGGTAGQIIAVNTAEDAYEFIDKPSGSTPATVDVVDWMTLVVQGKATGTQTGIIGSTGFSWIKQVTYRTGTYFRVTGTNKDGWYTGTTTSTIGTAVPNAQREK